MNKQEQVPARNKRKLRSVEDPAMPSGKLDTSMRGANMRGYKSYDAEDMSHCDFTDTLLLNANLSYADLSGSDMTRACLVAANMSECTLDGTALPEDLRHANLSHTDVRGYDFGCAQLTGANLEGCWMAGADLSQTSMGYGTSLRGTNLRDVRLPMIMALVDLGKCDLSQRTLRCDLASAVLDDADLRGTDLSGCRLVGASLLRCHFDEHTRLPHDLTRTTFSNAHGLDLGKHETAHMVLVGDERAQVESWMHTRKLVQDSVDRARARVTRVVLPAK